MLNKVMLIGRLGRDPELRYTQTGTPVTTLNVATDESYIDREGNKVDKTEWHRVTVFQRQAENCTTYLGKGSLIYVEGSLQTRKWQDNQGQDRYTTEVKAQRIQFLERRPISTAPAAGAEDGGYQQPRANGFQKPQSPYGGHQNQNRPAPRPAAAPAEDDYGMGGYAQPKPAVKQEAPKAEEDLGPAFPSEAATASMDEVPF